MSPLPLCLYRCAICMVDFVVGEPIRLLPCMHFYHMRCIDEWLMRSFCCPSCMERVDDGMLDTLISSSSPAHSGLRRRRRRRGERGSSSSIASLGAAAAIGRVAVEGGAKRREGTQFVRQASHPNSGQTAECVSGQAVYPPSGQAAGAPSGQVVCPSEQVPIQRHMNYLTDLSTSGHSASGHSAGQVEEASGGYDRNVHLLNNPELAQLSQGDLAYSMDQITFCDFQAARGQLSPLGAQPSPSTVTPSNVASSPRFSPPVFEYHFEYPSALAPTSSTQQ